MEVNKSVTRLLSIVLALTLTFWGLSSAAVLCLHESGTQHIISTLPSPFEDSCHAHEDAKESESECHDLETCCAVVDCTHIPLSDQSLLALIGFDSRERLPPQFEVLSMIPWDFLAPKSKDFLIRVQARAPPNLDFPDIHLSIPSTILLI